MTTGALMHLTLLFKQQLLHLLLWNKQELSIKQDYNCFPQRNIVPLNQPQAVFFDGWL